MAWPSRFQTQTSVIFKVRSPRTDTKSWASIQTSTVTNANIKGSNSCFLTFFDMIIWDLIWSNLTERRTQCVSRCMLFQETVKGSYDKIASDTLLCVFCWWCCGHALSWWCFGGTMLWTSTGGAHERPKSRLHALSVWVPASHCPRTLSELVGYVAAKLVLRTGDMDSARL